MDHGSHKGTSLIIGKEEHMYRSCDRDSSVDILRVLQVDGTLTYQPYDCTIRTLTSFLIDFRCAVFPHFDRC